MLFQAAVFDNQITTFHPPPHAKGAFQQATPSFHWLCAFASLGSEVYLLNILRIQWLTKAN